LFGLKSGKIRVYNPTTALASLATVPVSVASATQRAGRAGRTSPGICYRLYPMSVFTSLPSTTSPEITRTDMTTPILQLKSLGIDDLMKFDWVSAPPAETVLRALEGLHAAGMIDAGGKLTVIGEQVSECPVEVGIARMVRRYFASFRVHIFIALLVILFQGLQVRGRNTHNCCHDRCPGVLYPMVYNCYCSN